MKRKMYLMVSFVAVIATIGVVFSTTNAASPEPGTVGDPVVTKSYVDQRFNELSNMINTGDTTQPSDSDKEEIDLIQLHNYINAYIDSKISEGSNNNSGGTSGEKFVVVELEAGTRIIGGESTEFILRGGNATAVANATGNGLTDITSGVDLKTDDIIPYNHLLIVPRPDGRGLDIKTKSWVMVKGSYEIIQMSTN